MPSPRPKSQALRIAHGIFCRAERDGHLAEREMAQRLSGTMGKARLDDSERARVRDLVHGVLRHRGLIDHLLGILSSKPLRTLERSVTWALRLGTFRLVRPGRAPRPAAVVVKEAVDLLPGRREARGFVNAVLRALARGVEVPLEETAPIPEGRRTIPWADGGGLRLLEDWLPDPAEDPAAFLAAGYSHPRWIVDRWRADLGAEAAAEAVRTGASTPPFTIRVNRRRATRDELAGRLRAGGVETTAGDQPDALHVVGGRSLLSFPEFEEGLFYVQDETPMDVVRRLDVRPGHRVLDLCAAPGGKATHIAEHLGGEGGVWACDVTPAKLARIEENARRLGHACVQTVLLEPDSAAPPAAGPFDRILVDAPCSNSGVFRRRPEARWRLSAETLASLRAMQEDLLERVAPLLAPDGLLVYSTCAIEPEECGEVVAKFLGQNPRYHLIDEGRTAPTVGGPDGGFVARIGP